jgi:hypothetical protein
MNLPRRQRVILERMDRALGAADPQLRSSYAAFTRRARGAPWLHEPVQTAGGVVKHGSQGETTARLTWSSGSLGASVQN